MHFKFQDSICVSRGDDMKILILTMLLAIAAPVMAREKIFKDGVGIASDCLVMPVGRVLLIGRDNFVEAVKFLQNEERPDGSRYSKYEYFEYENGFKKIGEGEISFKPSSGKGIFFHESPYKLGGPLKLRNFSLFAVAGGKEHSTVYFWSKPNKVDHKVRMAPTPWKEIGEVNLSDPRIKWFSYDKEGEWKVIPIEKIWD